jgi:anti-sigma factor RsiW
MRDDPPAPRDATRFDDHDASGDLRTWSALVDGELTDARHAAALQRLARDPEASRRVTHYCAQKAALKALFAKPDVPRCLVVRERAPWWRRVGIAACWLAIGIGLGVGLALAPGVLPSRTSGTLDALAQRADSAYVVFAVEQRHPVEVGADQREQLVKWLSARLGRPVSTPSMEEYGYALLGGRLLPGDAAPAAQLMYQNATGARLALYVSATGHDQDSFGVLRDGNRRTFYWTINRVGYALSGDASEPRMREIAHDVCAALGGEPGTWRREH